MTTEHDEALAELRTLLKPGDTVHTILRHVSRSGITRAISPVLLQELRPFDLTYHVGRLDGWKRSKRYEGIEIGGCGMDMGFALVYNLSRTLFPDGYDCIGEGCPSNDHSNGDRNYNPDNHHNAGGYALRHRWL